METAWIETDALLHRLDAAFYGKKFVENERRITSACACTPLSGLALPGFPITNGIRGPELADSDKRMLRLCDVDGLWIDSTESLRVSDSQYQANRRAWCRPGDLLLAIGGYIGVIGKVVDHVPQTMGQHAARLSLNRDRVDPDYVLGFFATEPGKTLCQRYVSGAVQVGINLEDVREIPIPLPEKAVQRAIGNKLRRAERLRALACQAIGDAYRQIGSLYGSLPRPLDLNVAWTDRSSLAPSRLDAWFHSPHFLRTAADFKSRADLTPVRNMCHLVRSRVRWTKWPSDRFFYYEIGGVSVRSGKAEPSCILASKAPSRAKYLVQGGDVLVSTVRPNLKSVGQIPTTRGAGVASSGFAVLRSDAPEVASYVRACLSHDAGTQQMMRWNTGGAYPAIDGDVVPDVLVPNPGDKEIRKIGKSLLIALDQHECADALVSQATSAVEGLIGGTLNEHDLLSEGAADEKWLRDNATPQTQQAAVVLGGGAA